MDEKTIAFNLDQLDHIRRVQSLALDFCTKLMDEVIRHDATKFCAGEYSAFIESRDSLNASLDGKDEDYQRHLKSKAIQDHITTNAHHPEFWDRLGEEMPLIQAIIMYFDWKSRCDQKGGSMADFREHNHAKLGNHPGALALVQYMERCRGLW